MKKLLLFLLTTLSFAQCPLVSDYRPIADGLPPAANTTGMTSIGPMQCLGSTPNRSFHPFQLAVGGNVQLTLTQGNNAPIYNNLDVDFACWGPYSDYNSALNCATYYGYQGNVAVPNNLVACSYSASGIETFTLNSGLVGQYYVIMVTNFSTQPGFVNLIGGTPSNPISGLLSSDIVCNVRILNSLNGDSDKAVVCGPSPNSVTLTATPLNPAILGPVYKWYLNGVLQPTITTASHAVTQSGTWKVEMTSTTCGTSPKTDEVVVQFGRPPSLTNIGTQIVNASTNCTINLQALISSIAGSVDISNYNLTFHTSNADATSGANPILNLTNYSPIFDRNLFMRLEVGGCPRIQNIMTIDVQCLTASATGNTICQTGTQTGTLTFTGTPNARVFFNDGTNNYFVDLNASGLATWTSPVLASSTTYSLTSVATLVPVDSVSLNSTATISVDSAVPPTVGTITQPTCTVATGSVELTGLPAGNWTINPGSITGNTTTTTISGLTPGSYNYTVTNSTGCISGASTTIVINSQPITPSAPGIGAVTQPSCSVATGSIELIGLPTGNWTINPGGITGNTSTTIISSLAAGNYNFTVTNTLGCISSQSATAVINTQAATPATPSIGAVVQPTCSVATGSIELTGLPSGNWTINPGGITGNTSTTILTGLSQGNYSYTVTNALGCTSAFSVVTAINSQPLTPSTPTGVTTLQPTCTVATGSVELSGLPSGSWTINPGGITGTTSTTTISGLAAGNYNFTVTNSSGCTSLPSNTVTINTQPITPVAPSIGVVTQPTCTVATGSVELTGLPTGNWTINPGGITGNTATTVISGLASGTYTYTVTNASGCISTASNSIVINTQPATPAAPVVSSITQPTCSVATGSVALTGLPSGSWTINPGGITGNTSTTTISGLAAGNYNFTVTNSSGCISAPSNTAVINTQPITPVAPSVVVIAQPNCSVATGSIQLSGLPSGNWTINPGGITGNTNTLTLTGLVAGTYNYTVTNSVGCQSSLSANVVINTQPGLPTGISITGPALVCAGAKTDIILTATPGTELTWNGTPNLVIIPASGRIVVSQYPLSDTTYAISYANLNGCGIVVSGVSHFVDTEQTPQFTSQIPDYAICSGQNLNLAASLVSSVPGATYEWELVTVGTNITSTGLLNSGNQTNIDQVINLIDELQSSSLLIKVRPALGDCKGNYQEILITVNSKPTLKDGHICVYEDTNVTYQSYFLSTNTSNPNFRYKWFKLNITLNLYEEILGETSSSYEVVTEGTYQVEISDITNPANCIGSATAFVKEINPATDFTYTVTDAFTDNATITVTVNPIGNGVLQYALDNGAFQTSNVFTNVESGSHQLWVVDQEGCTNIIKDNIFVIDYPKYFTPNGDGFHDTWNIFGMNQSDAKLYIFDRYGKLVKQLLVTDSQGWNGTLNGKDLPSSDYWFTLEYKENNQTKQFKSHFSLKR